MRGASTETRAPTDAREALGELRTPGLEDSPLQVGRVVLVEGHDALEQAAPLVVVEPAIVATRVPPPATPRFISVQ